MYENEAGALNEHLSDVFGIMVKQFAEGTTAEKSDWLIGEGCLAPGVTGVALRNMISPGTAYDDPRWVSCRPLPLFLNWMDIANLTLTQGKDAQPATYDAVQAFRADPANKQRLEKDHGGVHFFSGVPNRAFALIATQFQGNSWEKAGKIWWTVATEHRIPPRCTFIQFADATVEAAVELFDEEAAKTVRGAWTEVGVVRKF